MKNQVVIAIVALLVIALGVQTYMIFQLNDKVNQLNERGNSAVSLQTKKSPMTMPKPDFKDPFFDDQSWNPYEEMQRMQTEMEQVFNNSFSRFHNNQAFGSFDKMPEIDLKDKSDAYVVTVNVPGIDKSSLNVKLENQQLQISVKTEGAEENSQDKGNYQRRERFVGTFHRILTLPGPANPAKMTTDYNNGVLTITIPKQ